MSADDLARLLQARKCGAGRWRARCPVHRSKGLTLAIYAGEDRSRVFCHAGCSSDDVMATLGLTWKDTLYRDTHLTREEKKQWAIKREAEEQARRAERRHDLQQMLRVVGRPIPVRTESQFDRDLELFERRVLASRGKLPETASLS